MSARLLRALLLCAFVASTLAAAIAQDNWNGGTGNWSNPGKWSTGAVPTINNDTTIYSGSSDFVTLDTPGSVKSLILGGTWNGLYSELTDNGVAQSLNIANSLFVGQSGVLNLSGGTVVTAGADSINAGSVSLSGGSSLSITGNLDNFLLVETQGGGSAVNVTGTLTNESSASFLVGGSGDTSSLGGLINNGLVAVGINATLNLTNQPNGITDAVAGSVFDLLGSFTAGGNQGFANLNSVEGLVNLFGQGFAITPGSGTLTIANTGLFNIDSNPYTLTGSTMTINGDVLNSGDFFTGQDYGSSAPSTVTINGNITNNPGGSFEEFGQGYNVTAYTLTNNGYTYVGPTNTLTLTAQPAGITDVVQGSGFDIWGTFSAGSNNAFAGLTSVEGYAWLRNGQATNITPSGGTFTVSNTGDFESWFGSTVQINGNVSNGGTIYALYGGTVQANGDVNNTGNLWAQTDAVLQVNGNVSNSGSFYQLHDATVQVNGNVNNTGDMAGGTNGLFQVNGNVSNSGGIFAPNDGTVQVNGDVNNTGTMRASDYGVLQINGNLSNSGTAGMSQFGVGNAQFNVTGTLTNQPGGFFSLWIAADSAMVGNLVNQGTVYIGPGATLDPLRVDNFANISVNGTMVVGTGTPGGPGYYQFADGTLGEHIDVSQFGVIVVGANGAVDLNGTLDIQLASGFNPTVGSSYDIITFTSGDLNGTFASVLNSVFNNGTEKWTVIYNNSGGYVELLAQNNSAVPELSSFLMLGTGLLGLSYSLRRRLSR